MCSQFVQAGDAPSPPSIDERRLRAFQQRIDRDEKIEAGDRMPDEYRKLFSLCKISYGPADPGKPGVSAPGGGRL